MDEQAYRHDDHYGLLDQRTLMDVSLFDHQQAQHETSDSAGSEPPHENFAADRHATAHQSNAHCGYTYHE
jgi:hypothetical protein